MRSAFVYLASPIDRANDEAEQLRDWIKEECWKEGVAVYNPVAMWDVPCPSARVSDIVQDINRAAILRSDAILIVYPEEPVFSVGTFRELEFAMTNGIHSCMYRPGKHTPSLELNRVVLLNEPHQLNQWLHDLHQKVKE